MERSRHMEQRMGKHAQRLPVECRSRKNVNIIDSTNCVVHSSPGKMVIIQGLDDYIVADTEKGLLICRKDKEQDIKEYIAEITKASLSPLRPIEKTNGIPRD